MHPIIPIMATDCDSIANQDRSEPETGNIARRPLRLLLLCDFPERTASTITDHIFALKSFSEHSTTILNSRGEIFTGLELARFDGIIIHYSLVACMDAYIGPSMRSAIREFSGLKAAFVQDDYRWINQTVDALQDLGIHVLFGLVPPEIIDQVYSPEKLPGVIRETVLTGYVPDDLTKRFVSPLKDRRLDVGYRARKVPAWLGSFGQEKWLIAERFKEDARRYGLTCDFSTREEDRIYGEQWIEFLSNCKAVLGTESGSSVCDFTGEIQSKVEAHIAENPDEPFETIRDLFLKEADGKITLSVISPRCFEAAALRTLMILYEGEYSGRLQPWRHYVPLKKDHSNMAEVVSVLRDRERAQGIVDAAFQEVALNPANGFSAMVRQIDRTINRAFREEMIAKMPPYSEGELAAIKRREARRRQIRNVYGKARNVYGKTRRVTKVAVVRCMLVSRKFVPKSFGQWVRKRLLKRWPNLLDV